ncbi:glycosyltransferase family A protein [Arenibaculum sp.]|uniref:glycosyltransferase family 2 protein n=1 Tax=Arenibaculum sp. TaxID=2865862 RepID=UPI002E104A0C|nr:glycosyltransferase family A protein [Arenibaculum sp.]
MDAALDAAVAVQPETAVTLPASGGRVRVCVCVATCGRPQGLLALMAGLAGLRIPAGVAVEVAVVDNDPAGSPPGLAEEARARCGLPLVWLAEPRRGISFARNAGLDHARRHADFIAFIDDDETPSPDWLAALLRVALATGAAAVVGPVLPRFAVPAPAWAVDGGFYACLGGGLNGTEPGDGEPARLCISGNVLVRTPLVGGPDGFRFDEALALTGGEDTLLFAQMRAAGHSIVYARLAIVPETVPESRLRLAWLLRRWYRTGNTDAFVRAKAGSGRARLAAEGVARMAAGAALAAAAALAAPRRPGRALARVYTAARGAGMIGFAFGRSVEEYRRIHGS